MNIKQFRDRMKKSSAGKVNVLNWKKEGKLRFVVHPEAAIGERQYYRLERIVENDDGQREIWGANRLRNEAEPFIKRFLEWLENEDSIDLDDIVFRLEGTKETREYCKGDLLGLCNDQAYKNRFDWKKNMFRYKGEFLICARPWDKWDEGWFMLQLTPGAGKKWWKVIESQLEEEGEVDGDYTQTPMVFKITFDGNADNPGEMYAVERLPGKQYNNFSDERLAAFEEPPVDIEAQTQPGCFNPEGGTAEDLIKAMLVVPCPLFEEVQREEPVKQNDTATNVVKDEVQATSLNFEKGKTYEFEGDKIEFAKEKNGDYLFVDEDGFKVKLDQEEAGEIVPFDDGSEKDPVEQFAEETMEVDGVKVRDCEKGQEYYTFDGEVLTFSRYLKTKNKGKFKDSNNEWVQLDGDQVVSPVGVDMEDDPLAPIEDDDVTEDTPETVEKTDELEECGVCGAKVPVDATECPDCGAIFGVDEDDLPDFS